MASKVGGGPSLSTKTAKAPVSVEVIATLDWDNGVGFLARWEHPAGVWNSGPMVFKKGDPDRMIEYTLIDQTGLGLEFHSPADEAIWVDSNACPVAKPPAGSDKGQIKDKNRPAKDKLTLKNVNDQTCTLHYALRFTGASWTRPDNSRTFDPPYEYDPDYRNGGGGGNT